MKLKIWYLNMIVSVLKFLVSRLAKGYHIAKDPVHTRPRKKKEVEGEPQGII